MKKTAAKVAFSRTLDKASWSNTKPVKGDLAVLFIALFMLFPNAGNAQDENGAYIKVTIEYRSMFPRTIQVRDDVCGSPRHIECEKARIKAESESCQGKRKPGECREAAALMNSSFCIEGLIYEQRHVRGDKVELQICTSATGFGSVSLKGADTASGWTSYPLLKNGDRIVYP